MNNNKNQTYKMYPIYPTIPLSNNRIIYLPERINNNNIYDNLNYPRNNMISNNNMNDLSRMNNAFINDNIKEKLIENEKISNEKLEKINEKESNILDKINNEEKNKPKKISKKYEIITLEDECSTKNLIELINSLPDIIKEFKEIKELTKMIMEKKHLDLKENIRENIFYKIITCFVEINLDDELDEYLLNIFKFILDVNKNYNVKINLEEIFKKKNTKDLSNESELERNEEYNKKIEKYKNMYNSQKKLHSNLSNSISRNISIHNSRKRKLPDTFQNNDNVILNFKKKKKEFTDNLIKQNKKLLKENENLKKIADNNNEFKKILSENENLKKEINDLKKEINDFKKENLKLIKTLQEDF
jgi:hypothetical protein